MPDEMDQTIQQLRALPKDQQAIVIESLKPDKKAALMARLQPTQASGPSASDYAMAGVRGVGGAIKDVLYSGPKAITEAVAKPPTTTGERVATLAGPAGLGAYRIGSDMLSGLSHGAQAREQARQEGENWAGQALRTIEQYPFIGETIQGMEKGGPGRLPTPESFEGGVRLAGDFVGPEVALKGAKAVTKALPPVLRERAAILETENIRSADKSLRGKNDYGKADALEIAQQGIIAGKKALPEKIEARRFQLEQERMQKAQAHNQQGVTVDGQKNLAPIARTIADRANARGVMDEKVQSQINELANRTINKWDDQAKQWVPRNLSKLPVSEAIELTRHNSALSEAADFEGNPTAVKDFARAARKAIIDEMPSDVVRLGEQESHLIRMREQARARYEETLNDRGKFSYYAAKHAPSTIAFLAALKLGGIPAAEVMGGLIAFRAIAQSSLSRTARAAAYARMADLIDGGLPALQGHTGAPPQQGGPMGGPGQIGPQPVAPQGVTPPQGGLPPAMAQGPQPLAGQGLPTRPPQLPTQATRARAGSGAYAKVQPKAPLALGPSSEVTASSGTKVGASFENDALAQAKSEMPNASASEQLQRAADIRLEQQGKTRPKPVSATPEQMGRAKAKVDPSRNKAMMDRLDTLFERQDHPKSGADRVAIAREIDDIKKIVGTTMSEAEKKPLIEKLQTRERVQAYRERQRAQTPVSTGATSGEMAGGQSASTAASPEQLMIAIQTAYQMIPQMPGGAEFIKNFQKDVKNLKMTPEQEFEGLREGAEFLHQFGDQLGKEEE